MLTFFKVLLWPLDRALALLAFVGVWGYRRWISPRKGYDCAAGALTDEPSCSAVASEAFLHGTFSQAIPVIRAQLAKCRRVYAEHSSTLLSSANAHLTKLGIYTTVGVIGACSSPEPKEDPDKGPLGRVRLQEQPPHDPARFSDK